MRRHARLHAQLVAVARREAGAHLAEDIAQDALVVAIEAGRCDFDNPDTARWLMGVTRNRARMTIRTTQRRKARDTAWWTQVDAAPEAGPTQLGEILVGLSPALRTFAILALTGHDRRDIGYLLGLSDAALRQRVRMLRRHMRARGLAAPGEPIGLTLDLAYGRLRAALLPALLRHGGAFASHDPDGHLFIVRRSQNAGARQQVNIDP